MGWFLSADDAELRRLSKQANQRLVRLERFQKKNGTGYTPAYEQAEFYLQDVTKGKKRFTESVWRLSEEEKHEQRAKVTAFLNNPLSRTSAVQQRENLKKEILQHIPEDQGLEGEDGLPSGLFGKTGINVPSDEDFFWKIFNKAKAIELMKSFDYQDVAKAVGWKLETTQADIFDKIVRVMENLTKMRKLSLNMLYEDIATLNEDRKDER